MSELPENWTVEPFNRVARYATGRTPARAQPAYWTKSAKAVPWAAISDMEEYGYITETAESISETAFQQVFRERIVPAGTLLMSFKLTIGRVATLGVPACHNEAIIAIYPRTGVDQRYLGYFLSQVDYTDHQDRQIKGNTLNQSKIDQIQVALPPSAEQARIADVLDKCRVGISNERAAEATTLELKRAVMRELFTRGLRGEVLKEVEIGLVPESWRIQRFDQTVLLQRGFDLPTSKRSAGFVTVFGSNGPVGTHFEAAADVPVPTVMVGRSGSVGKVSFSEEPCWPLNTTLFVADYFGNEPRYVRYWLEYFDLSKFGQGVSVPTLNRNTFANVLVAVPKWDEQREIVAILDALDRKIALHRQKRVVLEDLFNSLLHKLMTGEIRVADLDLSSLQAVPSPEATV